MMYNRITTYTSDNNMANNNIRMAILLRDSFNAMYDKCKQDYSNYKIIEMFCETYNITEFDIYENTTINADTDFFIVWLDSDSLVFHKHQKSDTWVVVPYDKVLTPSLVCPNHIERVVKTSYVRKDK